MICAPELLSANVLVRKLAIQIETKLKSASVRLPLFLITSAAIVYPSIFLPIASHREPSSVPIALSSPCLVLSQYWFVLAQTNAPASTYCSWLEFWSDTLAEPHEAPALDNTDFHAAPLTGLLISSLWEIHIPLPTSILAVADDAPAL